MHTGGYFSALKRQGTKKKNLRLFLLLGEVLPRKRRRGKWDVGMIGKNILPECNSDGGNILTWLSVFFFSLPIFLFLFYI